MNFSKIATVILLATAAMACTKPAPKPCNLASGEWCTFPGKVEIEVVSRPDMPDVDPTKLDDDTTDN